MSKTRLLRLPAGLIFAGSLALLAAILLAAFSIRQAHADEPAQQTEAYCLSCHGKSDLSLTLPDGETLSLYISPRC